MRPWAASTSLEHGLSLGAVHCACIACRMHVLKEIDGDCAVRRTRRVVGCTVLCACAACPMHVWPQVGAGGEGSADDSMQHLAPCTWWDVQNFMLVLYASCGMIHRTIEPAVEVVALGIELSFCNLGSLTLAAAL